MSATFKCIFRVFVCLITTRAATQTRKGSCGDRNAHRSTAVVDVVLMAAVDRKWTQYLQDDGDDGSNR